MKDKYLVTITTLSVLLIISVVTIILAVSVINDLKLTAGMYKNSKEVCRMEYEELIDNYEKLEKECNK